MAKQYLSPFALLTIILLQCTTTSAQSSAPSSPPSSAPSQAPAPTPSPSGPTDIIAILKKAGHFTTLIRLLKTTNVVEGTINHQLNISSQGLTLLAPSDNAFGNLTTGTMNSLSDPQKVELVLFHVLQSYIAPSQFQTASNPLLTLAGVKARLPLNVTMAGSNVNISTGVVNATVEDTVYTDGRLAVYQVNQVLLPLDIFGTPALAPAPSKPKKAPSSDAPSGSAVTSVTTSSATILIQSVSNVIVFVVSVFAAFGTMS